MEDKILVIVPPNRSVQLDKGVTPVHPAYRVTGDGRLLRSGQANPRGGAMLVDCGALTHTAEMQLLVRQTVHECAARNFGAVVCVGGGSEARRLAPLLDETLARRGLELYVPESWGEYTQSARVLIGTALSGGSLACRLEEAAARFGGPERIALWVERVAEDFFLPAPQGSGRPLTGTQLQQLRTRLRPGVFFSRELCARYFTYMSGEGNAHFVLFDDAATIRKKLQVARRLGIFRAVARWEDIADLPQDK